MKYLSSLLFLMLLSCNSDKVVQLPGIDKATVTEVYDNSPAYLFYDETQPDSIELNRKNLISTTNWLVNVDKRLTLKQAIPKIQFIQEKKRNSSHKNQYAKNFYTCHDLSQNNLGFIEFTDVNYHMAESAEYFIEKSTNDYVLIDIPKNVNSNFVDALLQDLFYLYNATQELHSQEINVLLKFDHSITFQQYILVKSKLQELDSSKIRIDTNEFIY